MPLLDRQGEFLILDPSPRGRTVMPSVVAAGGDAQNLAHRGDFPFDLIRSRTRRLRGYRASLPSEPGCCFCQDFLLFTKSPVLPAQLYQFLALRGGQTVLSPPAYPRCKQAKSSHQKFVSDLDNIKWSGHGKMEKTIPAHNSINLFINQPNKPDSLLRPINSAGCPIQFNHNKAGPASGFVKCQVI